MVSRNIKTAKEGGIWTYLIDEVLKEWIAAGITKYVIPPKQDGQTRTLFCSIQNRYGGSTKILLNSIDTDSRADAERVFKERSFSMIYVSELSKWKTRHVLDVALPSLRMPGLPYESTCFLSDTNPSDEGEKSWIWQTWWGERLAEEPPETYKTDEQKKLWLQRKKELHVIEIFLEDNPFLSKAEKDSVFTDHAHDRALFDRYCLGKWVTASGGGIFTEVFREEVHVIGQCDGQREGWEVILPPENTSEIFTGFDIGDKNTVAVFMIKQSDEAGKNYYSIIDEVVIEDEIVSMDEFVSSIMQVMDKWEKFLGHPVRWQHFSDNSSLNYKIAASATEQLAVRNLSGGRIQLLAADKYAGADLQAANLIKRLFFENRLFISANCFKIIQAVKSLKPVVSVANGVTKIPKNIHRHKFDAIRYCLMSLEPQAMARGGRPRSGKVRPRIVSMA